MTRFLEAVIVLTAAIIAFLVGYEIGSYLSR